MRYFLFSILIFTLIFCFGCSTNENEPVGPEENTATLTVTVTAAETYYLNLSQAELVPISDYLLESDWDIAIDNLTRVRVNGGATAPGNVFAVAIDNASYNDLKSAPNILYKTDTQTDFVIGENWYFYDISTHTVSPLDVFYIIKTVNDEYFKFMIIESNFSSRSDGELKIRFDKVTAPNSPEFQYSSGRVQYFKLPLSNDAPSYFSFKEASTVAVSDEQNSTLWDLKTNFVTVSLNGGVSGPGQAGAQLLQDVAFDSLDAAPAAGYAQDDTDNGGAIGDSWYTYDFVTHTLTANSNLYVIQTAAGHYAKLEFVKTDFSGQDAGIAVMRFHYIEGTLQF
jgi:hypothetical protein